MRQYSLKACLWIMFITGGFLALGRYVGWTRAALATSLLVLLVHAWRWALWGETRWPRGLLGVALTVLMMAAIPSSAVLLLWAIGRVPQFWWYLPPAIEGPLDESD